MTAKTKRAAILLAVGYLLALAAWNMWRFAMKPTDDTAWFSASSGLMIEQDVPSGVAAGEGGQELVLRKGDLVLAVAGQPIQSRDGLHQELERLSQAKIDSIRLEKFHPKNGTTENVRIGVEDLKQASVRNLPPAVRIRRVFANGNAAIAGIQPGDLIIGINNHDLSEPSHFNPVLHFEFGLYRLAGLDTLPGFIADTRMQAAGNGSTVEFEIVREGRELRLQVELNHSWIFAVVAVLVFVLFTLLSTMAVLRLRQKYRLIPFLFSFLVFFAFPVGDPSPTVLTYVRDGTIVVVSIVLAALLVSIRLTILGRLCVATLFAVTTTALIQSLVLEPAATTSDLKSLDLGDYLSLQGVLVKIFHGGRLSLVILLVFLVGLFYLALLARERLRELSPTAAENRAAWNLIEEVLRPRSPSDSNPEQKLEGDQRRPDALRRDLEVLAQRHQAGQDIGYYGEKVLSLARRLTQDPDLAEATALRDEMIVQDEYRFARELTAESWCRSALPILGFLGTVMGISGALNEISGSVLVSEGRWGAALPGLKQGFVDMAFAFDTTFFGLLGFLLLGGGDKLVRTALAGRLERVRAFLASALDRFSTSSKTGEVMLVGGKVTGGAQSIEGKLSELQEEAEFAIHEYDPSQPLREILFAPMVDTNESVDAITHRVEFTHEKTGGESWDLVRLGLPSGDDGYGFALIRSAGKEAKGTNFGLLKFPLPHDGNLEWSEGGSEALEILPSEDGKHLVVLAASKLSDSNETSSGEKKNSYQLLFWNLRGGGVLEERSLGEIDVHRLLPLRLDEYDGFVAITDKPSGISLTAGTIQNTGMELMKTKVGLRADFPLLCCTHPMSGSIFFSFLDQEQKGWRLRKRSLGIENQAITILKKTQDISFNSDFRPKQIIAITEDEILALSWDGELQYLVFGDHPQAQQVTDGWDAIPEGRLWAGAGRRFAVASRPRDRLGVWSLRESSKIPEILDPDRDPWRIFGVPRLDSFRVGKGGRYLAAIGGRRAGPKKEIITWRLEGPGDEGNR